MPHAHLPCLSVDGFGVAFGPKVVLSDLEFGVPALSVTALLGPVGAGKSCLLRSLAGLNFANQRYQEQGRVLYQGRALADGHRPRLAQLNARAMMASTLDALLEYAPPRWAQEGMSPRQWCGQYVERMGFPELEQAFDLPTMELPAVQQRALALLREAVCEPALLLVDEPITDLPDYEAYLLLDLLRILARTSAILLTLDSPRHVQMVAQHVVVLERGRVQEVRPVEDFVLMPHSSAGQHFIGTGGGACTGCRSGGAVSRRGRIHVLDLPCPGSGGRSGCAGCSSWSARPLWLYLAGAGAAGRNTFAGRHPQHRP